ncbi:TIGR02300 family protein [Oecophyllibacter saccharovorans]|uniref:TIGR02300 family protein n=1 Tax=Oecophyllibacter saccharovorans TaxID=2558360 RepID=UPI0011732622|nr:TIGR02300 family protein [Oecophyllibacter saccharovorans]TPW36360.1 TIGR02300 family protein [Oecophyllibacter saccharovorans]
MAQAELGLKRTCVNCGARFYDLNRDPAVCPKCDETQPSTSRLKRRDDDQTEDKIKKTAPIDENDVDLDADDDADVMNDDDDLDDDDITSDIEVTTTKDEREDT